MAAYTLTIDLPTPLKLYVTAHDDAGAIVVSRSQVAKEFRTIEDDATLDARVLVSNAQGEPIFDSTVRKMVRKARSKSAGG